MNWYFEVLKKYAVFSGRARRKEYWMFALVNAFIFIGLIFISDILPETISQILLVGYFFGTIIPSLSVCVRRLHDIGKSGWWVFIDLIPYLGSIILLGLMCLDSQPGENKYGPNPKGIEN